MRRETPLMPLFMRAFKSKWDSFGGWQIVGNEVELMSGQRLSSLTEINEALCSFLQVENLGNFHLCKEFPETCNYGSKQNNDEITASRDGVELTLSSFLLGLS